MEVRSGVLSIAPVAAEDRVAAELLLTRAFAGTAEERSRDLVRCSSRRVSTGGTLPGCAWDTDAHMRHMHFI